MNRVFVTGATGFIGCRFAEVASQRKIPVVALVRNWSRAARLARLPSRMVQGDVLDLESLRANMKGCDVVFHCAVDNRVGGEPHRRSSALGAANVMQAALETGVKQVVHLSSIAVYSYRPAADARTEDAPYAYCGDAYCDGKIDAEKSVLRYCREYGIGVTVLRPTIVYGPFGSWTEDTVKAIRQRKMALIEGGAGVCNALYVDNLVEAMLLAAEEPRARGEVFHISDRSPVTWKEFINGHARALGGSYLPLPEVTVGELAAARRESNHDTPSSLQQMAAIIRDPHFRQMLRSIRPIEYCLQLGLGTVRALLPDETRRAWREKLLSEDRNGDSQSAGAKPIAPLFSQGQIDLYTTKVVFSVQKARQMLNYDPKIDFGRGMELTSAWIKWARL